MQFNAAQNGHDRKVHKKIKADFFRDVADIYWLSEQILSASWFVVMELARGEEVWCIFLTHIPTKVNHAPYVQGKFCFHEEY